MNPTLDVIARRRSVRAYADQPLTAEEKTAILQAAFRAPTAGNMMLYSIIEVEDQALKVRLAVTCDNQPFIARAPFVLLFVADYQRWYDYFHHCRCEERARELGLEPRPLQEGDLLLAMDDALIAAQNTVIAAEALGIGSCYIGDVLERYEEHRALFELPRYALPAAMLCYGHPQASRAASNPSPRFPAEYIVFKNRYHRLQEEEFDAWMQPLAARYFRDGKFMEGAENIGQHYYLRKFIAEFSHEMSRSVRAMLRSWTEEA